jgi:FkbM family methyltransferase
MRLIKNKPIDLGEVLLDAKPRGVIHAGAHLAEELPIYIKHNVNNRCWIEANPYIFSKMKEIVPPEDDTINVAVTDEETTLDFNLMSNGQSSSLLPFKTHLTRYPKIKPSGIIRVEGRKFDSLIDCGLLDIEKYDLLYMDLQGAEFKALKGFTKYIHKIKYILSEINYEELYEGCMLINDFDKYLLDLGFVKQWATIHESVGWGDAYYKRVNK